ncbi:unnamed protein product [Owenia fusiformis]|uniref:Uncharacterized protein n=1 Tax=Owenia fusiformis TaxID=6347 RepID=A0A8J1T752_OWEFU|nr:unnamed protein product [Owenia fusiformis]
MMQAVHKKIRSAMKAMSKKEPQENDENEQQHAALVHSDSMVSMYYKDYVTGSKEMDLRSQGLKDLTIDIEQDSNLETIDLSDNELTSLPQEFGDLPNVRSVNLMQNSFCKFPREPLYLKQLTVLNLKRQAISSSYASMGADTIPKLTDLPSDTTWPVSLEELTLSENAIHELPKSLATLQKLRILDVRSNKLREFPIHICGLKSLTSLILSSNKIEEIPEEIGQLTNLKMLRLSKNKLCKLPDTICSLVSLETLTLRNNQLTALPVNFDNLQGLKNKPNTKRLGLGFFAENNAFIFPPQDVCESEVEKIFKYLDNIRGNPDTLNKLLEESQKAMEIKAGGTEQMKYEILKDEYFRDLSTKLGKSWKSVASYLKLTSAEIETIELNNPGHTEEQIFQMLIKWRDRSVHSAKQMPKAGKILKYTGAGAKEVTNNAIMEKELALPQELSDALIEAELVVLSNELDEKRSRTDW